MGAPSTNFFPQDQQAWKQASDMDTAQAYSNYLSLWPEGTYASEARRLTQKIKEETLWNWALRQNQIYSFEKYLEQYPEGYFSQQAYEEIATLEEEKAWEKATSKGSISSYLEFRRHYPESQLAEEAAQRIVSLVKKRSSDPAPSSQTLSQKPEEDKALERATMHDSVMAYNQFLRTFPETKYREEVQSRISQLEERLSSNFQLLENEVELWDKAARLHTRYAYQEYLQHFPTGKFSNLAKNRLQALDQQWKWKHRAILEEKKQEATDNQETEKEQLYEIKTQAAKSLGWLWLCTTTLIGGLSIWLAPYLLPMVVVVSLAFGAHVVMNRGNQLTRNESLPYLLGGSLAIGSLVQGLVFQLTTNLTISLLSGVLIGLVTGMMLVRFFQNQMEKAT